MLFLSHWYGRFDIIKYVEDKDSVLVVLLNISSSSVSAPGGGKLCFTLPLGL